MMTTSKKSVHAQTMVGTPAGVQATTVPLSELKVYPRNPRRGDLEMIKHSLRCHGPYRPLIVNRRTKEVVAGNHLLLAMRELGYEMAPVWFVDVDEETAARIVLIDNRASDVAGYDSAELLELLSSLPGLDGTGYGEQDLDALLEELGPPPLEEEELPPLPAKPRTRSGELLVLGEHVLACGDAGNPNTYPLLLEGSCAELLVTDPPWGVNYLGKTERKLRIENDAVEGLAELLGSAFACADSVLLPGAPLYVFSPGGPNALLFAQAFVDCGWLLRQQLVWVKNTIVLGRSDYHYRHEPILYGFKPGGAGRLGRGGSGWFGDNKQSSVLEVERPRASREHPTTKPPELLEMLIANSSRRRALVLDPFAGSGSTLVACERLRRRARLVEIEPAYCDVIAERYRRLTGNEPEWRAA
jgi:DNA modification methylase